MRLSRADSRDVGTPQAAGVADEDGGRSTFVARIAETSSQWMAFVGPTHFRPSAGSAFSLALSEGALSTDVN